MNDSDREQFAQLLQTLGEVYGENISTLRAEGYFDALRDLPMATVGTGIRQAMRSCRFFPRPVELREQMGHVPVSAAWVNRQLSEGISGKAVGEFVTLFVQRLGGWRAVEDRLPIDRLPLVERLYPGIVAACQARQIPIPTEAGEAKVESRMLLEQTTLQLEEK